MNGLTSGLVFTVSLLAQSVPEAAPSDERFIVRTLKNPFGFEECGFSPDGKRFVARHDNGLQFWDVGGDYRELRQDDGGTMCFAISPDSTTFVNAGGGPIVAFCDAQGKRMTRMIATDQHPRYSIVSALRFSPDGKQLAVGMSRRVALYDFASGTKLREFASPFEQSGFAAQAAFLDRDRLLVRWETRDDGSLGLTQFDLSTGAVDRRPFPDVDRRCYRIAQSHSGRTIALVAVKGEYADVTAVDVATRKVLWKTPGSGMALAFSPDERYLALTGYLYEQQPEATAVRIFRLSDGKLVKNLKQKRKWFDRTEHVRGIAFSPDGKTLATCSSNLPVTLWDWTKIEAELPQ